MELQYQYTDEEYGCVVNPVRSMFSKRTRSLDNLNHILQIKSESILIFFRVALKFEKKHDLIIKLIWD